jgi:hypothetical protein
MTDSIKSPKLKIEDIIGDKKNKSNKNNSHIFDIPKNQKEFGHKKRIKP